MIKKGEAIKCDHCGEIVLIAAKDIPFTAPFKSEYYSYPDGKPIEYASLLKCCKCNTQWRGGSI